ncbi:hypothetical protein [Absidia glauca]|uniref:Uncharacterized protein n=1 Tax=Absidia glauca TaxID=4829 RepID=A0A168R5V2_ABSGL|nr:hypothetical protein [Absidia glauca]
MFLSRPIIRSTRFLGQRYQSTYTTSSTEYVYGLSSVACALHAEKRKLLSLNVQQRLDSDRYHRSLSRKGDSNQNHGQRTPQQHDHEQASSRDCPGSICATDGTYQVSYST